MYFQQKHALHSLIQETYYQMLWSNYKALFTYFINSAK